MCLKIFLTLYMCMLALAMAHYEELQKKLSEHGQEHLLDFWATLSESDRSRLTSELNDLDLPHIIRSFNKCTEDMRRSNENLDDRLEPLPKDVFGSVARSDTETLDRYRTEGVTLVFFTLVFILNMN